MPALLMTSQTHNGIIIIIILSVSLHVVFTCVVPTGPDTCWLVGWLNVSNAELSPKRYLQRSRSQEVGEEADYT